MRGRSTWGRRIGNDRFRLARFDRRGVPIGLLLAALLTGLLPAATEAREEYSSEGGKACLDCHATPCVLGIMDTVHAQGADPKTPAAQKQCQSCHGPSARHMQFPMQIENVHFGSKSASKPQLQNEMCLECHSDGEQTEWAASAHGYDHIVCSTCHSMHDPSKIVPSATTGGGCTESCHQDLMGGRPVAEFSHAVGRDLAGDGILSCDSCHNPHGPLHSGRCVSCHAQTPDVIAKQSEKARRYHEVAATNDTECMRCHKGLSHAIRPLVIEETSLGPNRFAAE